MDTPSKPETLSLSQLLSEHEEIAQLYRSLGLYEREIKHLRLALDMVAEEREAWKARALGLPQEPCRHADHPSLDHAEQLEQQDDDQNGDDQA